jgi:hypothetical protein
MLALRLGSTGLLVLSVFQDYPGPPWWQRPPEVLAHPWLPWNRCVQTGTGMHSRSPPTTQGHGEGHQGHHGEEAGLVEWAPPSACTFFSEIGSVGFWRTTSSWIGPRARAAEGIGTGEDDGAAAAAARASGVGAIPIPASGGRRVFFASRGRSQGLWQRKGSRKCPAIFGTATVTIRWAEAVGRSFLQSCRLTSGPSTSPFTRNSKSVSGAPER